jgi:hypothetical protein
MFVANRRQSSDGALLEVSYQYHPAEAMMSDHEVHQTYKVQRKVQCWQRGSMSPADA